jgi:hypothetical protein
MTLKSAATFAFIGTLLATALLVWNLIFDLINVVQGVVPAARLVSSLIYTLAALSLAIFFYAFQKTQK